MSEIVNRVQNSKLIQIDLEDYYPEGKRMSLDIAPWLWQGLALKEKDFRETLKQHSWNDYRDAYVAVYCSADAVIPTWAYMLVGVYLAPEAKKVVYGTPEFLEATLFESIIDNLDIEPYEDGLVMVKGCGKYPIPTHAFIRLATRLQPVVKKLSFGEACSSVPLWRK